MLTLAVLPSSVKLVPLAVPTVAETALADRLAFLADGGDPDDYRPEWAGDQYEPTPAEFAEHELLSERDAVLKAYFERLDWEAEYVWEQREIERYNREVMGYPIYV